MASSLDSGKIGEQAAAEFLIQKGYRIAERNWRSGRAEIDIIAWLGDQCLVFVEVKTRSSEGFGGPEAAIDRAKMDRMARIAGIYMDSIGYDWAIRFDTIAVILSGDKIIEIRHVEDAFFPMG
jgi:putative endonuclease